MPTDSALSWGILLFISICGFCHMVKVIADEDTRRHGGNNDV